MNNDYLLEFYFFEENFPSFTAEATDPNLHGAIGLRSTTG